MLGWPRGLDLASQRVGRIWHCILSGLRLKYSNIQLGAMRTMLCAVSEMNFNFLSVKTAQLHPNEPQTSTQPDLIQRTSTKTTSKKAKSSRINFENHGRSQGCRHVGWCSRRGAAAIDSKDTARTSRGPCCDRAHINLLADASCVPRARFV